MSGQVYNDSLTNMLKDMKSDEELDTPSFLRRPVMNQRNGAIPNTKMVTPQQQPAKQANRSGRQSIEELVNE